MILAPPSYGIGIDIGGTSTRVVVFDDADRAVHHDVGPTAQGPEAILDDLTRRIGVADAAVADRPATIGVGIPGTVVDGVVTMALNVAIDGRLDLARALSSRVERPVHVENDVNAAALGARTALDVGHSVTYLSIGTGLAAGTVIGDTIVRGAAGAAGEIGHVPIPGRTERCVCGQSGCIEAVASGRSVVARMRAVGLDGDVVELWDAADRHHDEASAIRADMVAALAWSVQVAVLLADVDAVVLGGGVALALGERLGDAVRSVLSDRERVAPFLAAIRLADRVRVAPPGIEFGSFGAHRAAIAARPELA